RWEIDDGDRERRKHSHYERSHRSHHGWRSHVNVHWHRQERLHRYAMSTEQRVTWRDAMRRARAMSIVSACFAALPALANAQTYDSGSTGVDGALTLPAGTCVGLTCTIPLPPSGEFNYTTVTIPGGYPLK